MNQFGNFCSSYRGDGYEYQNANGSRYISYPDGSSFYDPGSSGVGRKWYTSPDGQKHFLDDEPKQNKKVKYEDSDDSDATDFLSPPSAKPCISLDGQFSRKPLRRRCRRRNEAGMLLLLLNLNVIPLENGLSESSSQETNTRR